MEYTKIKNINEYVSESVSPMNTPEQIFEMYSVPIYSTGHPEYLHGNEIASNKVKVRKNDVLLCKINPRINRVWIVADESAYPCIASSEWIVIRNSEYNPEFLAWYFRSPKFKQLMTSEVTGIGGSLTRAQPKAVAEYPVPVIERQEQDVITEILNKIYNIIDARRREINILDDLIKARFVELFGDPVSNSKGLPIATLPELGEFGRGVSKHRPRNDPNLLGGDYPLIQTGDVAAAELYITDYSATYSELGLKQSKMWDKGTLCITIAANIAKTAILTFDACFPDSVVGFMANERTSNIFIHYWFSFFQAILESQAPESAQKNINLKILSELKVINPSKEAQVEFESFVKQVDKSKVVVQKALDEAQVLFDCMMQQYFG
ncbi:restriction endonuclease subunit S [Eubacterium pyruvativorans]|uniref:restriction endonuclease subunit S n=1 Tax=Eubacterium pyruvativorans TaxID=155865 RepID=UPI003F8BDF63